MVNSQSTQRPDLQDLVAYIQGRGSEDLRAQVLKRLDEDEAYMDLMLDLVPMLREAGECQDPDAEPAPAPAPLRLAAPPVVAAPAVADPPAGGKVIMAPDRFRRRTGLIAAAALVPIAIGVWLVSQRVLDPRELAVAIAQDLRSGSVSANPFDPVTRSANDPAPRSDDLVKAGTHLLDLELALGRKDAEAATDLLNRLKGSLDPLTFAALFEGIARLLEKQDVEWRVVNKQVADAYRDLPRNKEEEQTLKSGICWRAVWLAAHAKDASFFSSGRQRDRCMDLVDPEAWKADTLAVENAFYNQVRRRNAEP